ncbi:MAG: DUF2156 domain-containing protein [Myxococcales bacterium]|nr:DUF2156 domain-containing protein [Myxococcales bacterium]
MTVSPALAHPLSAPDPRPRSEPVRRLLALPARLWDGPSPRLPQVPAPVLHQRLLAGPTPPEGWLALQAGLGTVGDARYWASVIAQGRTGLIVGGVHGADRRRAFQQVRDELEALGVSRQAVYPVREPDLSAAEQAGFATVAVGTEAWVDLAGLTLGGKRFADLRQMVNRAERHQVSVREVVDPSRWQEPLVRSWSAFLAARRVPWRIRWLSGGLELGESYGRRTFVAHRDGVVQAFCTVLPGGSPDRRCLDVMCRDPAARPGSMEGLLVSVLRTLRDEGVGWMSLGPCPLAGDAAQSVKGTLGAAFRWAWGTSLGDRWFGLRRLAAFKEKFRPQHEVVHLGLAPQISPLSLYLMARIWALGD